MILLALLSLPAAALLQTAPAPRQVPAIALAESSFARLKALVGVWRPADAPSSQLRVRFYLSAGGTTLVESWERAGQPHSLTLYHRDGDRLIATHYCPQGNQPRLALAAAGRELRFTFLDATDLAGNEPYLHDLALDLTDPARPVRRETYRQGAERDETTFSLIRVADAA